METIKALSIIYAAPSTYNEINNFIVKAKRELLSGDYNPLDVEIQLKAMEEIIKQLMGDDEIRQAVIDEAEKYGKSFDYRGCKISVREGGVKYDYTGCGDTTWRIIDTEITALTEAKKAREKYLQNLPPEGAITPDGEAVCRPVKTSKTTVAVTLK